MDVQCIIFCRDDCNYFGCDGLSCVYQEMGKRNITLAGAVVAIAAQVCLMLNPNNFYYMFAITLIRSAGVAQLNATVFGMLGDVVEYSYWKNGFRQESMILEAQVLDLK